MLEINDLHVQVKIEIIKKLNLKIKPGEIHAIMGPNGSGKSTLSKAIAGHPSYDITKGKLNTTKTALMILNLIIAPILEFS